MDNSVELKPSQQEFNLAVLNGEEVSFPTDDLYIPPNALKIFLESFEGPLDLLLYFIRKQNLDILEINVLEITNQYVAYIDLMEKIQFDLAGEYLVMAAYLTEIKSRMMLPKESDSEDEEDDPRSELIRRLQEYERYKTVSKKIDAIPRVGRDFFVASSGLPEFESSQKLPEVDLNKLSQIKRARPVNEMVALQQEATINAQGGIRNAIMRIENIRRGGLVSQLATAARNLSSATIRAPLEGLGNVVDNVLYQIGKGDYLEAVKGISPIRVKAPEFSKIGDKSFFEALRDGSPLGFTNNWKDSFRHMKYMFDNPQETKEVVDFILERPELQGQYKLLFDNVNEIMISTGRGKGGVLDKVLSEGEDAVMALNLSLIHISEPTRPY